MKYCVKCHMPNSRPGSIFNEKGVCQACINYENRKNIDWEERKESLKKLCNKYRRNDGFYDCLIPVSGGKDSHRLVYIIKELMGMNPLLVTIGDPFTKTIAGSNNYKNLGETFDCDHFLFDIGIDLFKKVTRIAFEETGEPLKFIEVVIYTASLKLAVNLGIPFVVFGENSAFEYGTTNINNYSANDTIFRMFKSIDFNYWINKGIPKEKLNSIVPPSEELIEKIMPEVIYMSYFVPWSSVTNLKVAQRYGFVDLSHEWKREGYIEDFEQIDSVAYIIHLWLKYPKFGFQRTSDIASRRVREGLIGLEEAKKLIEENDPLIDQKALDDFCSTLGYSRKEFWDIVDKWWNQDLFEKKDGIWSRKTE